MRYRLRTLLVLLAIAPPIVGWYIWPSVRDAYVAWRIGPKGRNVSNGSKPFRVQWGADSELSPTELFGRRAMQHALYSSQMRQTSGLLDAQQAYVHELATVLAACGDRSEELCRELNAAVKLRDALQAKLEELQAKASWVRAALANLAAKPGVLNANPTIAVPTRKARISPDIERAMLHDGATRQ